MTRIRAMVAIMIVGLVVSGATAIPLQWEMDMASQALGIGSSASSASSSGFTFWLSRVREGLTDSNARYPFLAYGTDWLAFGHFMIALVFVWAWRQPVRNAWLFDFGLIACGLLVPYALVMGQIRGIPLGWRLIDSSFGVGGMIPLLLARRWLRMLPEAARRDAPAASGNDASKL